MAVAADLNTVTDTIVPHSSLPTPSGSAVARAGASH
jgi:hypothetical protein